MSSFSVTDCTLVVPFRRETEILKEMQFFLCFRFLLGQQTIDTLKGKRIIPPSVHFFESQFFIMITECGYDPEESSSGLFILLSLLNELDSLRFLSKIVLQLLTFIE